MHRRAPAILGLFALAGAPACTGMIFDVAGEEGSGARRDDAVLRAAPVEMRRLTRAEYLASVGDLLAIEVPPLELPIDESVGGFEANTVSPITPTAIGMYMEAAETLASAADPLTLVPCDADARACAERFVEVFGRRAFRRPLTHEERLALLAMYDDKVARASHDAALRLIITAFLQAPSFLYRPEAGVDDGRSVPLDGYELATRLAFLLWSSTPDDALLDAAESGALGARDGIVAEARRMLEDPRARRSIRSFHRQWLDLERLAQIEKDGALYPEFDRTLAASMEDSALLFAESATLGPDGGFATLLTSSRAWVDPRLASFFGVPHPGEGHVEVELDASERAGVLTTPAFLAVHANADSSSPILRGRYVRQRLLCQTIPPPPADIVIMPPPADPTLTTRERFRRHTESAECATCHVLMDPIGFGFEHYDAVGRFRETDNGIPVDGSGQISATGSMDGSFDGIPDLAARLAHSALARECYARQWLRYVLGRPERDVEEPSVAEIAAAFERSDGDVPELLVAIVESDAFRFVGREE